MIREEEEVSKTILSNMVVDHYKKLHTFVYKTKSLLLIAFHAIIFSFLIFIFLPRYEAYLPTPRFVLQAR